MSSTELLGFIIFICTFTAVLSGRSCEWASVPLGLTHREQTSKEFSMNRPILQETVPTTVNVSLRIIDANVLNSETMDIEYNILMTQKWQDHRLAPDYQTRKWAVTGAIWHPKVTFIVGSTCARSDDSTQYWRGTTSGSVLYSEILKVRTRCTKNLRKYPFDTQQCPLKLGSYRFTLEEVNLLWDRESVEIRTAFDLGEFQMTNINTYHEVDLRSSGNFSVLVAVFNISRHSQQKVATAILPSSSLTLTSCLVFWMKTSAVRSRIFLCKFLLAGILYLHVTVNQRVPSVAYFKALDIWFAICAGHILMPFFGSIVVNAMSDDDIDTEVEIIEYQTKNKKETYAAWIDKILRFIHPAGFLSCTVIFFIVFVYN